MEKINTRFNPTVNGPLHLGHLYCVLVNAHEAHKTGGEFIVRFDDNQDYWIKHLGLTRMEEYADEMIRDIAQFTSIERVHSERKTPMRYKVFKDYIDQIPAEPPLLPAPEWHPYAAGQLFNYRYSPLWVRDPGVSMYPYAPDLTAWKVLFDYMDNINLLIRGDDLITEFSLYCEWREKLGQPQFLHAYIPRLDLESNRGVQQISKTLGGYKIGDMVNIYTVPGVLEMLKEGCLIDPTGEFDLNNLKANPRLRI